MATRLSRKALGSLAASAIALPALMLGRSYPWQLALPVAIAVGLLVFSTLSTIETLRGRRR